YAHLDSPIHRWEQGSKLIALLALIFAFAFVEQLILLPAMIVVTTILYWVSQLPFSFLLRRLRYPGFFILAVVISLPFVAGDTVIFNLGMLSLKQEGCVSLLLIVTRFICILTVSLILFGTAPFLTSIKAMRSLGLPDVIVDMMLLSYRYLEELGDTLKNMQIAMQMRGFQRKSFSRRNLKVLAELTGTLIVRSYDQSKRVYQAMILRGYGNKLHSNRHQFKNNIDKVDTISWILFSLTLFVAIEFIIAEIFL
ncbi:MAG: cobalt ECF transporter T component CbiQ, partial [Moorea sp. SIO2B7]|nr:cobalt ECF transporter T component CbiQ [Moorena sp. SIO2B7]